MTSNELSEKFDKTFWEYLVIKNAMKEGKVYDIDRFWDGKTLFNCPLAPSEESGNPPLLLYRSERRNKYYLINYEFDWINCLLRLIYVKYDKKPYRAQMSIVFDELFGVKEEVVQDLFKGAAERIITEVEKMIENDKEGNRNS